MPPTCIFICCNAYLIKPLLFVSIISNASGYLLINYKTLKFPILTKMNPVFFKHFYVYHERCHEEVMRKLTYEDGFLKKLTLL